MLVFLQLTRFEEVAAALDAAGLALHDVRACVFPSRPEPRSARWELQGREVARYICDPHSDLRALWITAQTPDALAALHERIAAHLGHDPFESWNALRHDLVHEHWPRARRAAAAFGARARHAADPSERARCARALAAAYDGAPPLQARRAIIEQLGQWTHPEVVATIEAARGDQDLEVRLHAHRARARWEATLI